MSGLRTALYCVAFSLSGGFGAAAAAQTAPFCETVVDPVGSSSPLAKLIEYALAANPRLEVLRGEVEAAWSRVPQARALPDPNFSTNVFGQPIETAAGAQQAFLTLSQRLPWFKRLDLQGRQAAVEAQSLEQVWAAEQLKVIAAVKLGYYRLYVVNQEIRINEADQQVLQSLARVASARVKANAAGPGDVLLANLELSRLAEELVNLKQRLASTKAELNRLLNRPAIAPLPVPTVLKPSWNELPLATLLEAALQNQPELQAAVLAREASLLGVSVARLQRVPDLTLGATYYFINDDRPLTSVVEVGKDAWLIGASINLPIWHKKYNAIEAEAMARNRSASANLQDVLRRYEAIVADLRAQAQAAKETVVIYDKTVLPLAKQTLAADRKAYQQGRVEFDRVITDFRNLVNLESSYHRAIGRLAAVLAQLEQAIGVPRQMGMTNDEGVTKSQ